MTEQKKPAEHATELEDQQLDRAAGGRSTSGDADDRPTEEVAFAKAKTLRQGL